MLGTPKQDQDMRPADPSPYHQKSDIPPAQDVVLHNSASTIPRWPVWLKKLPTLGSWGGVSVGVNEAISLKPTTTVQPVSRLKKILTLVDVCLLSTFEKLRNSSNMEEKCMQYSTGQLP